MLKGKNMKKQYLKPQMKVVEITKSASLLAGSGKPDQWGAPGLDFDDSEEDVW